MIGLLRRWIAEIQLHYQNPLERRQATGITIMNIAVLAAALIGFLVLDVFPAINGEEIGFDDLLPFVITPVLIFAIQRLILSGNIRVASQIFVGLITVGSLLPRLEGLNGTGAIILMIPVVAASLLLNRRDLFITMGVVVFGVFFATFNQTQNNAELLIVPANMVARDLSVVLVALGLGVALSTILSGSSENLADAILENRRRLDLLRSHRLMGVASIDAVLVRVADLLMEELLYTHAQVYLLDDEGRRNAYIRTGMGTRFSVNRVLLDSENALRKAVRQGKLQHVSATSIYEERSHFLPSVTYALALPLMVEGRVIGVLDIQSSRGSSAFDEDGIIFLELLASELAYSLVQVRQQNTLQQVLESREAASERQETIIADLRNQIEQGLGTDWTTYLRGRGQNAFGFDLNGRSLNLTPASDFPEHLKPAMLSGEILVETHDQGKIVNIPIKRYDNILGAMSFIVPSGQPLTERQIEMANAVATRLATALENARLVEQTRAQAERERKAGEISNLLLGQQEVHALLDAAAQSFNDALGAIYTRIYLEPEALMSRSEEAL